MLTPDAPLRTRPAKLNLTLSIVGRRPDGYHRLDSLFVFVGCVDRLSYAPAADFGLAVEGPFSEGLGGPDNLVARRRLFWRRRPA